MTFSLVSIQNARVKSTSGLAFSKLNFSLNPGETWAIVSDSGSLQSAFLQTILGKTHLSQGKVTYPFADDYRRFRESQGLANSPQDLISFISSEYRFKNKSNLQNFYFQQRFNSSEVDDALSVRGYLENYGKPENKGWSTSEVADLMKLDQLLDESILKLSNGETRRLAIALGLMENPRIFLMDHPTTGLDKQSRETFSEVLKAITTKGIHVILTCSSHEIPEGVSKVGQLNSSGLRELTNWRNLSNEESDFNFPFDRNLLNELLSPYQGMQGELIRLESVRIQYGDKRILESLNWKVNAGECWQVKGPNGSGKSTLISLLIGENPQAYSQDMWLYGRKRGSGESIWDIKKPLGFVAPELARFFPANQTCGKVILSGLFDTIGLFKKVSPEQEKLAEKWIKLFQLEDCVNTLIQRAPIEKQRWVLLARALIKRPALLILDEASQGIDELARKAFKETVELVYEFTGMTILYVSHYDSDIPNCVNRVLDLSNQDKSKAS